MQKSCDLFISLLRLHSIPFQVLRPKPIAIYLSRIPLFARLAKWLGYIDKYIFFPTQLLCVTATVPASSIFHIVDHSNAIYCLLLSTYKTLVTCNDTIAIDAALNGYTNNSLQLSRLSLLLQKQILKGLRAATTIISISVATRLSLSNLGINTSHSNISYLPLNYEYRRLDKSSLDYLAGCHRTSKASSIAMSGSPFILHVGGCQWYKNRGMVLAAYLSLIEKYYTNDDAKPSLVFVGPPLTHQECGAYPPNMQGIHFIENVCDEELLILYNTATLLFFPSQLEGFGWPILEALASGCLVLTSRHPPMTEAGGSLARYTDPSNLILSRDMLHEMINNSSSERSRLRDGIQCHLSCFSESLLWETYLSEYRKLGLTCH